MRNKTGAISPNRKPSKMKLCCKPEWEVRKLETIRAEHPAFRSDAKVTVLDTGCDSVLGISREYGGERLVLLFNFSEMPMECGVEAGSARDLLLAETVPLDPVHLAGHGFRWLQERA